MRKVDVVKIQRRDEAGDPFIVNEAVKINIQEEDGSVGFDENTGITTGRSYLGYVNCDVNVKEGDFLTDLDTEAEYRVIKISDFTKQGKTIRDKELMLIDGQF